VPPFNYDLGDAGKGPSEGFMFWTCYNSEREFIEGGKLEVTASQKDKDFILMIDYREAEKAIAAGNFSKIGGAPVIDPADAPGIAYFIPLAKSPHGVDVAPSGRWIVGSGKLSPTTTVFDIEKIKTAIAAKDFEETIDGIPVLTYTSVREAEIPVGLGPLHTQFDGKGYAYTSLFVESAVAKWKLPALQGPPPVGRPLDSGVGTADRHHRRQDEAPVRRLHRAGASLRPDHQGRQAGSDRGLQKGRSNLAETPRSNLEHRRGEDRTPRQDRRGVDDGGSVLLRSRFAINSYDINIVVDPGETKTVTFTADKAGVWPFYCTNFCSALHQEMQGYLLVK
jgi:nitrous oxide reductase